MSEEQIQEQIEAYLQGMMPEEEEALFQQRIDDDPALEEMVGQFKMAMLAVQLHQEEAMASKLDEWRQKKPKKKPFYLLPWLKWAVILATVVLLAWYFSYNGPQAPTQPIPDPIIIAPPPVITTPPATPKPDNPPPSPRPMAMSEQIVREANKPLGKNSASRGKEKLTGTEKIDTIFLAKEKMRSGKETDFNTGISLLDNCKSCDAIVRAQWRGHLNFKLRKYQEAMDDYKYWFDNGFSKKEAEWYVFLACLQNEKSPAETYSNALNALKNPRHPYHPDFLNLEASLKKIGLAL